MAGMDGVLYFNITRRFLKSHDFNHGRDVKP